MTTGNFTEAYLKRGGHATGSHCSTTVRCYCPFFLAYLALSFAALVTFLLLRCCYCSVHFRDAALRRSAYSRRYMRCCENHDCFLCFVSLLYTPCVFVVCLAARRRVCCTCASLSQKFVIIFWTLNVYLSGVCFARFYVVRLLGQDVGVHGWLNFLAVRLFSVSGRTCPQ